MWYSKYWKHLYTLVKIGGLYFYLAATCVNRFFCAKWIYAGIVVRNGEGKNCILMFIVLAVQTIFEEYIELMTGTAS